MRENEWAAARAAEQLSSAVMRRSPPQCNLRGYGSYQQGESSLSCQRRSRPRSLAGEGLWEAFTWWSVVLACESRRVVESCPRCQAAASGNEPQGASDGEGPLRIGRRPSDEGRITSR
jgi:hypothetical protein